LISLVLGRKGASPEKIKKKKTHNNLGEKRIGKLSSRHEEGTSRTPYRGRRTRRHVRRQQVRRTNRKTMTRLHKRPLILLVTPEKRKKKPHSSRRGQGKPRRKGVGLPWGSSRYLSSTSEPKKKKRDMPTAQVWGAELWERRGTKKGEGEKKRARVR